MTPARPLDVVLLPSAGLPCRDVLDQTSVTLAGRQARAVSAPASGVLEICFGDTLVARLGTTLPLADRATQSPLGLDRAMRNVHERTFVPRDQAAVVVQWSGQLVPFEVTLRFPAADGLEKTRLLASEEVNWVEEDHQGVRMRTTVAPAAPRFTLVVARSDALTTLDNLNALVAVRAAQFRRDAAVGLRVTVEPPSESIDALWLVPPLLDSMRGAIGPALALLLLGDHGAAREILGSTSSSDFDAVFFALLATRYLAVTGDIAFLRSRWAAIRELVLQEPARFAPILQELKTTAESIGEPSELGVPAAATPSDASWITVVQAGSNRLRPEVAAAVRVADELVHRTLGLAPDGTRQRIGIRPRFPRDWVRVEVGNIRVGEAALEMRYEQDGNRHSFRLRPTEGRVPPRVIFEPALSGNALLSARVDGTPASLVAKIIGERVVSPVQLVLNHERTVVLTMSSDG